MNTKTKLMYLAADLFSKYGYSGVSVRDIAKEMGFRESAMYKHYKNKADILESIINEAKERIENFYTEYSDENSQSVQEATINFYSKVLCFYTQDDFMRKFRRIMIISQYESEETQKRYNEMFVNKILSYYQELFKKIITEKNITDISPRIMAVELYSVLYLLIQQYDDGLQINEAINTIEIHIKNFFFKYSFLEAE